ncbi:hypothetical protein PG985_016285 [Apiospora marii]|uniref:Uncharacterized protein n=1 Tax=Apiospora marii TaxID=335849 RepID=A0ABR1SW88_9PEZI
MASLHTTSYHLPPWLPFVKSSNNSSTISSWLVSHCTIWHLLYTAGLVAAFVAGGVLGHLYWRRVRAWARRSHARVHRWTSARRDEVMVRWDGVVARLEGAVAGWKNQGSTDKGQPVITVTFPEERERPSSPGQQGGNGGSKRKRRHHIPGMGK